MNVDRSEINSRRLLRAGMRLLQAAALMLVVAMAMPAKAADSRAVKTRVSPVYPEIAKRMKIDGWVKVEVTVEADGKVSEVKTLSGNRVLSVAAEDAVRRWRFEPGPGQTTVELSINFSLEQ
jgi:TonB family protein